MVVARAPRGARGEPGSVGAIIAKVAGGIGTARDGVAFATVFALSAADWAEEDLPLSYQYQYLLDGDTVPTVLSQFQPSPSLPGITLPAGFDTRENNVTIQLCVASPKTPPALRGVALPQGTRAVHLRFFAQHARLIPRVSSERLRQGMEPRRAESDGRALHLLLHAGCCGTGTGRSRSRQRWLSASRSQYLRAPTNRTRSSAQSQTALQRCASTTLCVR